MIDCIAVGIVCAFAGMAIGLGILVSLDAQLVKTAKHNCDLQTRIAELESEIVSWQMRVENDGLRIERLQAGNRGINAESASRHDSIGVSRAECQVRRTCRVRDDESND